MQIRTYIAPPHWSPALFAAVLLAATLVSAPIASAKDTAARVPGPEPKIQWFGTWEAAKAEAKRTGRPILLTSAAPQCKGTSGIW